MGLCGSVGFTPSIERFNQEITRSVTGNRFPIIICVNRFRISYQLESIRRQVEAAHARRESNNQSASSIRLNALNVMIANRLSEMKRSRFDFFVLPANVDESGDTAVRCWLADKATEYARAINMFLASANRTYELFISEGSAAGRESRKVKVNLVEGTWSEILTQGQEVMEVYASLFNGGYALPDEAGRGRC